MALSRLLVGLTCSSFSSSSHAGFTVSPSKEQDAA